MKKTLICLMLVFVTVLSIGTAAFAEEREVAVVLDGEILEFDQNPVIQNGRTLVPLRGIFEPMGAEVGWDDATQTVTAVKDDITIKLTIGDNILYKNGEAITLDVPAQLIGSRTMVPARAVSEAFDARVGWIEEIWMVTIVTDETMKKAIDSVNQAEEIAMGLYATYSVQGTDVMMKIISGEQKSTDIRFIVTEGYILPSGYKEADIYDVKVTDGAKTVFSNNGEISVEEGASAYLNITPFKDIMNSLTLAVKTVETDKYASYDDDMGTKIIIEKETGKIALEVSAEDAGLAGQVKEDIIHSEILFDRGIAADLQSEFLK